MSFDFLDDAADRLTGVYDKNIVIGVDENNQVNFVVNGFPENEAGKKLILSALRNAYKNLDQNFSPVETTP